MKSVPCSEVTVSAWEKWLEVTRSRCHMHYRLEAESIPAHIGRVREVARETVNRVVENLPQQFKPSKILEVGASVGFNCLALAEQYPEATIYSVEPDRDAVAAALAMAADFKLRYKPIHGAGEQLPFHDDTFDLIICHTVIEHVCDVFTVVQEMSRVLAVNGYIHLEAPNYIWPHEPHLKIWCLPLLGKALVKMAARLQGKADQIWFVDHLQFVNPFLLTRYFNKCGLGWRNHVGDKAFRMLHEEEVVKQYKGIRRLLAALDRWQLAGVTIRFALILGMYPSVLYTVHKPVKQITRGEA